MPRGQHPNSRKALEENRTRGGFRSDNAVERGAKGNEAKRARKTFREEFEIELAAIIQQKDKQGNIIGEVTTKNAITKQAVKKAMNGDLRAMEFIRDTIGEKPAENIILFEADPQVITEIEAMVYDTP